MSHEFSYDELDDEENDESGSDFTIYNSIIFVVDGTVPMFKNDSFMQCLETYKNIIRQKCIDNKKDKIGLIVFGTTNTNCGIANVMVLQAFGHITVDTLINVKNMLKEGNEKYKSLASDSKYPLYDALTHAFQLLNLNKSKQKTNNIILLCTCNDNPCSDVPVERRRIEHLVAMFKDNKTRLHVVGLSDSWNDEIYYKDLQMLSGTFNNENYKVTYLKDFEQIICSPARSICRVPWKISSTISVEVTVFNLIAPPKYPSKIKLQRDDNEILETRRFFCEKSVDETINESENSKETKKDKTIITDDNIMYYKVFGDQNISFKPEEYKKIKDYDLESCIEVLAFKPTMCDPVYHCRSPYFITYNEFCNQESKIFFSLFVKKCTEKGVMPICKVIIRKTMLICIMIPSEDDGGFYAYKIPYDGSFRDLNEALRDYVFNSENECPSDKKTVAIFKEMMDQSKFKFDPKLFKNPRLEHCIAHIEALALDEKLSSLPPDSTCPPLVHEELQLLAEQLSNIHGNLVLDTNKRPVEESTQSSKKIKFDIRELAEKKMLHTLTVANLKEYLKSINVNVSGNKSTLIDRIYEYFNLS